MRPRSLASLVLAALLLLLQHEAQVHPIGHLAERQRIVAESGVVLTSAANPCLTCDLLAAGVDAPSKAAASPATSPAPNLAAPPRAPWASASRDVPYRSRAPPLSA